MPGDSQRSTILTLLLLPLLIPQALWVRQRTPRLPEASGPNCGESPGQGRPIRLVILGESTAAGVGAPTHEQALAGQTARALAQQTGRPVRWLALGRNGATTRTVCRELVPRLAGQPADAVVIALGVNDTTRWRSPRQWRDDLERLIAAVRQHVGPAAILLTGVPPLGQFPALPQPLRAILGLRAVALDRAAMALAGSMPRVAHLPVQVRDEADFAPDGYHPGPRGYAAWGAQVAAALRRLCLTSSEPEYGGCSR